MPQFHACYELYDCTILAKNEACVLVRYNEQQVILPRKAIEYDGDISELKIGDVTALIVQKWAVDAEGITVTVPKM
jgi:hypothetical protein